MPVILVLPQLSSTRSVGLAHAGAHHEHIVHHLDAAVAAGVAADAVGAGRYIDDAATGGIGGGDGAWIAGWLLNVALAWAPKFDTLNTGTPGGLPLASNSSR